jgi:DNA-binding XRE family transcriptional regulator
LPAETIEIAKDTIVPDDHNKVEPSIITNHSNNDENDKAS